MIGFVLVAFAAAPIEISVVVCQVGSGVSASRRPMMVYSKAGDSAVMKFMDQAIRATVLKILAKQITIAGVIAVTAFGNTAREKHSLPQRLLMRQLEKMFRLRNKFIRFFLSLFRYCWMDLINLPVEDTHL